MMMMMNDGHAPSLALTLTPRSSALSPQPSALHPPPSTINPHHSPRNSLSYLRLIDSCITQLKAQGPSRTCNESKEEEEEEELSFVRHWAQSSGAGCSSESVFY